MHGCVRAASSPHLVAIRMCASVTAARQRKCLPQMERWKEGTEEMVQNRRKMAASHPQTANQTRHKAAGKMMNAGKSACEETAVGETRKNKKKLRQEVCLTHAGNFHSGGGWCDLPPAVEGKRAKVSE